MLDMEGEGTSLLSLQPLGTHPHGVCKALQASVCLWVLTAPVKGWEGSCCYPGGTGAQRGTSRAHDTASKWVRSRPSGPCM